MPRSRSPAWSRCWPAGAEEVELGEAVEFAVYGEDVPDARLRELAGDTLISVTRAPIEPGWDRAWHEHIEPVTVGALTFRPPWLPGDGIVIEPGLTFGLASHPTTQLCLELLQEREPTPFADWGCGSGVLAIAAAKLGFAPVRAIEIDPAAVATARENARANDVDIEITRGDARRDAPYAPTVVANLTLPVLGALEIDAPAGGADRLRHPRRPGPRPPRPRRARAPRGLRLGRARAGAGVIRLAVRVDHEHAEAVLAELISLVPAGFEERDVEGGVEYVLYGAPGELPDIGEVRATDGARHDDGAARRLGPELAQLPQADPHRTP